MSYRPKCTTQNYKIPRIKYRRNLGDLVFGNELPDITPKAWSMREKDSKLDFIRVKIVCSAKGPVPRMKQQTHTGRKYLKESISDKGLSAKIHKEILKFNNKETSNSKKKEMEKRLEQTPPKKTWRCQIRIWKETPRPISSGNTNHNGEGHYACIRTAEIQNQKWEYPRLAKPCHRKMSLPGRWDCKTGTATSEDSPGVSYKAQHGLVMLSSSHAPW